MLPARFETQPLTPGGIDAFGVAVHVGVGPARVWGGGMTVAAGVGGRGVDVAGVEDRGGRVGGVVTAATGLAVGTSVAAAGAPTRLASPHPTARRTTTRSAARQL
ncbi:MAG: hypothetical protein E6I54_08660 [Chloroflexi bacterium]|nr:MAG: hypothetical protein E6I54_08660 [Chloroflexota bacterium]